MCLCLFVGPILLEDYHLVEKLAQVRSRNKNIGGLSRRRFVERVDLVTIMG